MKRPFYAMMIILGISSLSLTLLVMNFNAVWAQPATTNRIAGTFTIEYNYTDLVFCQPACVNISVEYDSETNRLSFMDFWSHPDVKYMN